MHVLDGRMGVSVQSDRGPFNKVGQVPRLTVSSTMGTKSFRP